jgi:hypothetical protein
MENAFRLPREFAALDQEISTLTQTLNDIDDQIDNLPPDRGHRYVHTPPGDIRIADITRDQRRQGLERQKDILKEQMLERVDRDLTYADEGTKVEVTEKADIRIHNHKFMALSVDQFNNLVTAEKSLNNSQEYNKTKELFKKYASKAMLAEQARNGIQQPGQGEESPKLLPKDPLSDNIDHFLKSNDHPDKKALPEQQQLENAPSPATIELDADAHLGNDIDVFMARNSFPETAREITIGKDPDLDI